MVKISKQPLTPAQQAEARLKNQAKQNPKNLPAQTRISKLNRQLQKYSFKSQLETELETRAKWYHKAGGPMGMGNVSYMSNFKADKQLRHMQRSKLRRQRQTKKALYGAKEDLYKQEMAKHLTKHELSKRNKEIPEIVDKVGSYFLSDKE